MKEEQQLVELLCAKIDECDDLIVEISQLRYQLEDILYALEEKSEQPNRNPA